VPADAVEPGEDDLHRQRDVASLNMILRLLVTSETPRTCWPWMIPDSASAAAPGSDLRVRPPRRRHRDLEGRDPCPPGPTGSVLGDALALVAACAHAAIAWHGRKTGEFEALLGRFGLAAALAPAPGS